MSVIKSKQVVSDVELARRISSGDAASGIRLLSYDQLTSRMGGIPSEESDQQDAISLFDYARWREHTPGHPLPSVPPHWLVVVPTVGTTKEPGSLYRVIDWALAVNQARQAIPGKNPPLIGLQDAVHWRAHGLRPAPASTDIALLALADYLYRKSIRTGTSGSDQRITVTVVGPPEALYNALVSTGLVGPAQGLLSTGVRYEGTIRSTELMKGERTVLAWGASKTSRAHPTAMVDTNQACVVIKHYAAVQRLVRTFSADTGSSSDAPATMASSWSFVLPSAAMLEIAKHAIWPTTSEYDRYKKPKPGWVRTSDYRDWKTFREVGQQWAGELKRFLGMRHQGSTTLVAEDPDASSVGAVVYREWPMRECPGHMDVVILSQCVAFGSRARMFTSDDGMKKALRDLGLGHL